MSDKIWIKELGCYKDSPEYRRWEKFVDARNLIEGALTYDPMIDCYKLKQYFQDKLIPWLKKQKREL